jgi:diguanylate cyclase (GGDEF)-like protein/PAS domain S-box-containing protein
MKTDLFSEDLLMQPDSSLFFALAESTTNGIILTNHKKEIIYVNHAFTVSTGYSLEESIGRNPRFLQSGEHDLEFYRKLWTSLRNNGYWQGEIHNKRKNGDIFIEWQNIMEIRNKQGIVTHYGAIFTDITERKKIEENIRQQNQFFEKQANVDTLTSLSSRFSFNKRFDRELATARLNQRPLALIFLDVDHFKLYNDVYGHMMGDEALKQIAHLLKNVEKEHPSSLASRFGGEEFIMILPGQTLEQALSIAECIREAVERLGLPHQASPTSSWVTVSLGCHSIIPDKSTETTELIHSADKALYRAKTSGRNRVSD